MSSPEVDIAVGFYLDIVGASANNDWADGLKIFDVVPSGAEVEDILTSHQEMTEGAHTYLPADIKENGELTLIVYEKRDSQPVIGYAGADGETLEVYTLTYPDGETAVFDGYVKSYTPESHSFNERMMATVVIKVSGDVT